MPFVDKEGSFRKYALTKVKVFSTNRILNMELRTKVKVQTSYHPPTVVLHHAVQRLSIVLCESVR